MMRLSASSGTSSVGQDLIPVLRVDTTLPQGSSSNGVSYDVYHPFRPVMSYFESDGAANVSLNGEPAVPLKDDGTGKFVLTLDIGMVTLKTFVIDAAVNYQATFLY